MIQLYPHNQKAYDSAVQALKIFDRTCIIHPTGTGKSLIIAKFIEDNPDKKHLVFAPSHHIFNEISRYTKNNFKRSTYAILAFKDALKELNLTGFDFIYLDEFHRCGAKEWDKNVKRVLEANPAAKKIGLTATHIRFLDKHKNMADLYFENNVSSFISLAEAINTGILPIPKYIRSIYFKKGLVATVGGKYIKGKSELEKINPLLIDWENSSGLNEMVQKYLPTDRNKIIVFCPGIRSIPTIKNFLIPILERKLGAVSVFKVDSSNTKKENKEQLARFEHEKKPSVLFSVDIVNEGLHVSGADVLFLFRRTKSPILFFQQIGRAFSVNGRRPIIFDVANSILFKLKRQEGFLRTYNIQENLNGKKFKIKEELIPAIIVDKTVELADLVKHFIFTSFEEHLDTLKKYLEEHGDLDTKNMPQNIRRIVYHYRMLKNKDEITKEKEERLTDLGMTWGQEQRWDGFYNTLVTQREKLGHIDISLLSDEDKKYVYLQRSLKKTLNYDKDREHALNEIGFDWGRSVSTFEENLTEVIEFKNKHGRLPTETDNKRLKQWMRNQIHRYKKGKLKPAEAAAVLEHIGVKLGNEIDKIKWDKGYKLAMEIFKKKGEVKIPVSGHKLSRWAQTNKALKKSGTISRERLVKLESINFVFAKSRNKKL